MNNEHDDSQGLISTLSERLLNGLFKENPTFVLLLGMCPTLAVTTSAVNGLGMGVTTMIVLAMSNLIISALRKVIPSKVRIPAFIVIIASFVTIVELLLKAYIPSLYDSLGIYIPLIVVNCIILGRAESYAYSHPILPSLFDGIGMGMGFSVALTIIGAIREILGSGKVFGNYIMPEGFIPVSIFVMAPGAFFVLAILTAIQNVVKDIGTSHGKDMSKIQSGCGGNCMDCTKECKVTEGAENAVIAKPVADKIKALKENVDKPKEKAPGLLDKLKEKAAKKEETKDTDPSEEKNIQKDLPKKEDVPAFLKAEESPKEETKAEAAKNKDKEEAPAATSKEEAEKTTKEPEAVVKEESSKNAEEKKQEETKTEEKPSEDKIKTASDKSDKPVEKTPVDVYSVPKESLAPDDEDELELLDLDTYSAPKKKEISGRRPGKRNSAREKAKAMLFKAEETIKEDEND